MAIRTLALCFIFVCFLSFEGVVSHRERRTEDRVRTQRERIRASRRAHGKCGGEKNCPRNIQTVDDDDEGESASNFAPIARLNQPDDDGDAPEQDSGSEDEEPSNSDSTDPDAIIGGIDVPSSPEDAGETNGAISPAFNEQGEPVQLQRKPLENIGSLARRCRCENSKGLKVDDIRSLSDRWMSDGTELNRLGFSNMLWSWGQFIDHDMVGVHTPQPTDQPHHNSCLLFAIAVDCQRC